jgi:hypothetical protein
MIVSFANQPMAGTVRERSRPASTRVDGSASAFCFRAFTPLSSVACVFQLQSHCLRRYAAEILGPEKEKACNKTPAAASYKAEGLCGPSISMQLWC